MASSSARKQCADDDGCKQAAVTNCEGCTKAFCIKHFNAHRRLLDEEMNIIVSEHDHLKNTLSQQATKPNLHPLFKGVNDWEKESIKTIQQRAKDLREELLRLTTPQISGITRKLHELSEKLKDGRENDDFIEADLRRWKETLNDLKNDLILLSTIFINRHTTFSLVKNITLILTETKDVFERISDDYVEINENGQVAMRDTSVDSKEIRGKNEYGSGYHEIRLCVEHLSGKWMFLGINAKSTPLDNNSYIFKSTYGWTSQNSVWRGGQYKKNNSKPSIEMKTNDVITLIIDCNNHKISMINERSKSKHELTVNIDDCPFPWQLHVNLFEPNSRVRILST